MAQPQIGYRVQYLDHRPGKWGPAYGDCWWAVMPDRRYTRVATAFRVMRDHAAAMTAPAFSSGVTRVIDVNDGRVLAMQYHHGRGGIIRRY